MSQIENRLRNLSVDAARKVTQLKEEIQSLVGQLAHAHNTLHEAEELASDAGRVYQEEVKKNQTGNS